MRALYRRANLAKAPRAHNKSFARRRHPAHTVAAAMALAGATWLAAAPARAGESAVVFMYHRFGDRAYPSTDIRLDQLDAQIAELKSGRYAVLPVPEILRRLAARAALPDRAIGLTVDDAYESFYRNGWPRLKAAGLPVTLFVATDAIGHPGMMTWDQIREVKAAGATIGAHSAAHAHMVALGAERAGADLVRSNARFKAALGAAPTVFAWPYGEYALALKPLLTETGYVAAFGQHSGAIGPGADFAYLPRFALNEHYGEMGRFRLAANALPLPVRGVTPTDPTLGPRGNPPAFGFTVVEGVTRLDRLRCYFDGRTARLQRLGERRIEVRFEAPFRPGRSRINCTMPADGRRWRWFGTQFYVGGG
jgi:peptidoglycan/xylan/chitin deacetylase (PgdA/CDA1 family)